MARPRQPVELVMSKGAKHLTKDEIETRPALTASRLRPI